MTIHEMAHLMVRVSWRKKSPLPIGRGLFLAPPARLELTTLRLGGIRSILVSYGGIGICLFYSKLVPMSRKGG